MEKLSHIIKRKIEDKDWKSIKVSREGPDISHLFFMDDLILFGEATNIQAASMKNCMDVFCSISGQRVSFPKSRIFVSKNISRAAAEVISITCGSPLTKDLDKYLGVPLIHGRINKKTYGELLAKAQKMMAT
ncbi:hypothetical protein ACOSQ3_018686 [Xanthoceras sorbifolium]